MTILIYNITNQNPEIIIFYKKKKNYSLLAKDGMGAALADVTITNLIEITR